jgi:predicted enzyme involved in methoxymalonyl-ACP biosynthesis
LLKLRDKFGDFGIIGVAILKYEGDSAMIDTFLMSCRALGRGVEKAFLSICLEFLSRRDLKTAAAEFVLTKKNRQAENFYVENGFGVVEDRPEKKTYSFDLKSFKKDIPDYFQVVFERSPACR